MKKIWEYKIIDDRSDGSPDSVYELNELGKQGWELVCSIHLIDGSRVWYFKRPKRSRTKQRLL